MPSSVGRQCGRRVEQAVEHRVLAGPASVVADYLVHRTSTSEVTDNVGPVLALGAPGD